MSDYFPRAPGSLEKVVQWVPNPWQGNVSSYSTNRKPPMSPSSSHPW